jgi:subtilisin family serine protease
MNMKTLTILFMVLMSLSIICCDAFLSNGNPKYERGDILIKCPAGTSLTTIDNLVPGVKIKTFAVFNNFRYVSYKTNGSEPVEKTLSRLNESTEIACAEKENVYTHFLTPDDSYYTDYQYAPKITGCETVWDTNTGASSVIVAVIDTGINGAHTDFGTGRVIAGYDFVNDIAITAGTDSDDHGHGSHVAGIIGATGNNGRGIAGLAWQTTLMPVKVLDYSGSGTTSAITAGIIWATDNGADIINMSLGGAGYSQVMADAVDYAMSNNITVVVAMGNDSRYIVNYPAGYNGVIAVGSTNAKDDISDYSTLGNHISVSAPGENIYSLSGSSNTSYVFLSGTSMASPFVAGLAALLLSRDPTLLPAEVRSIIEDSADDLGDAGYDPVFGYGRVDVNAAMGLSERNNYGKIRVAVNWGGNPISDIEALLMNSTGTQTLKTALTSSGSSMGGTRGEADFSMTHSGSYRVSVCVNAQTQTQDITLGGGGDELLQFNFTAGASYSCVIETFPNGGGSSADTVLYLYNSGLTFLTSNDDGGAGFYSKITYTMTSGATYYIRVYDYFNAGPDYYSILVNLSGGGSSTIIPDTDAGEPDNTSGTAFPMSFDTVYDRYLSLSENDWYSIVIP